MGIWEAARYRMRSLKRTISGGKPSAPQDASGYWTAVIVFFVLVLLFMFALMIFRLCLFRIRYPNVSRPNEKPTLGENSNVTLCLVINVNVSFFVAIWKLYK